MTSSITLTVWLNMSPGGGPFWWSKVALGYRMVCMFGYLGRRALSGFRPPEGPFSKTDGARELLE